MAVTMVISEPEPNSNVVAYIGRGAGVFLLEYTCSGQDEVGGYSPCIMSYESYGLETNGVGGEGKLKRKRSLSLSSKKELSP